MIDPLDSLLARPLNDVADNGFSTRVVARIARDQDRRAMLVYVIVALAALPLLFLLPIPALSEGISRLAPLLAASAPFGLAVAFVLLSLSFETAIREI